MGDNRGFTKTDMERVGLFREMTYHTIGDRYKANATFQFNEKAAKGKQMLPGGSKMKTAKQDGYFNDKFQRILEGEGYTDPVKTRRQFRMKESQKNLGKPFLPSSGEKKPSGLGNYFGTLGGSVSHFSPTARPAKGYKAPGKNFYTNPGKLGTGFGYLDVTINKYPGYQGDAFDRAKEATKRENDKQKAAQKGGAFRLNMAPRALFDENPYRSDRPLGPPKKTFGKKGDFKPFRPSHPAKDPGGNKSGTFDPYPSHSADTYKPRIPNRVVNVVNKFGKTFVPNPGPKSAPQNSVLEQNVTRTINVQNYKQIQAPLMTY